MAVRYSTLITTKVQRLDARKRDLHQGGMLLREAANIQGFNILSFIQSTKDSNTLLRRDELTIDAKDSNIG